MPATDDEGDRLRRGLTDMGKDEEEWGGRERAEYNRSNTGQTPQPPG